MSRGDGMDKVGYFAVIFCITALLLHYCIIVCSQDKVGRRKILEDSWKCFISIALVEVYAA